MPNTRELELWRLVNKAFQNSIEKFGDIFAKDVTRDLLANGLTVQEWISVKDRLPTEDEDSNYRIVGVVNGYNGKTRFTDAEIFVRYCHTENAWWSDDYDIEGCTVEKFYVVPQPPKGE